MPSHSPARGSLQAGSAQGFPQSSDSSFPSAAEPRQHCPDKPHPLLLPTDTGPAPGAAAVTVQRCVTSLGDIWGHPRVASSSPAAPFHSTERAERRGIIPNKTGMRKSAECWAVSRQPLLPPPRAPEIRDHERKPSLPCPTQNNARRQNRHSLLHQRLHTALPRSHLQGEVSDCQSELGGNGRAQHQHRISEGSAGMCPGDRAGRNPPPASLPMELGTIPSMAMGQGTPGSIPRIHPHIPTGSCGTPAAPRAAIPCQNIPGLQQHPGLSWGCQAPQCHRKVWIMGTRGAENPPEQPGHCWVWSPWHSTEKPCSSSPNSK